MRYSEAMTISDKGPLSPSGYVPRLVDGELTHRLEVTGAVLLEGPRAVGKTHTAARQAQSRVYLDVDVPARELAQIDPSLILEGATPRLLDEWQEVPSLWNYVRRAVDHRGQPGQFILTGSATPTYDPVRHTGALRIAHITMRPMTLYELGHSDGSVSLAQLFAGHPPRSPGRELPLRELVDILCVGGWPSLRGVDARDAQEALHDYLDEVARSDLQRVEGVARDPSKVWRVLRSLGRNVATEVAMAAIARDAAGSEALEPETAASYVRGLERLWICEPQLAWAPHLRSRARVRSSFKFHLCDPSLAVAAVGATPESLLKDVSYVGCLFESLAVRDLRAYTQHLGGRATIRHYRDDGGEIDIIIEGATEGKWAALEVKLGHGSIEQAAHNLKKVVSRIDTARCGVPAFLAIVVPSGAAYQRPDGVAVIPLVALGP